MKGEEMEDNKPLISAEMRLPEITVKAVVLGIILALVLAASNAYLGLKAGTTISASIPAAVISMGVLKFFKRSNVLENNIVQTAASAGEALVAGMIYMIPALLVISYWKSFPYWDSVIIASLGGVIGVLCSIPIRRILLNNPHLPFPEGVAIGHVLKASADNATGMDALVHGGIVGAIISFAQSGLKILSDSFAKWTSIGGNVIGGGLGFSPALIAAGYIIGVRVGMSILIGIVAGWGIAMPILSHIQGVTGTPDDFANGIGRTDLRYIGLGVMLLGGILTLFHFLKPFYMGLKQMVRSNKTCQAFVQKPIRTERDIPKKITRWVGLVSFIGLFFLLQHHLHAAIPLGTTHSMIVLLFCVVFALFASFVFSCLCGYFAGLVGSTNNPLSAMMLGSLIIGSFFLILFLGSDYFIEKKHSNLGPAAVMIIMSAIISCAAAITTDTIQDLKAGKMVGATPWKQQIMLILGVLASALVIPLILELLFNAYGMAGVYPRPDMDPSQSLSAPQAAMMAIVTQAVFAHQLPWPLLWTGFGIALVFLLANHFLKRKGLHVIVLAIGLGIYLPLDSTTPMVLGSFIAYLVTRFYRTKHNRSPSFFTKTRIETHKQKALLLACGMVAGSALMGVILAIPFALSESTDVLSVISATFTPYAIGLSIMATVGLLYWLYYAACHCAPEEK